MFAKLLYVFSIIVGDRTYGLAMVQSFDAYTGPVRRKDTELGLYRLGMKPRGSAEIISLESIERGALLVSDFDTEREDEFLVVDVLDGDMFLRVKEMNGV